MSLSPHQQLVLLAASSVDWIPNWEVVGIIPHGVYRSLVIRGLLQNHPRGYEITALGRDILAKEKRCAA